MELTELQKDIITQVIYEKSNYEIADELDISYGYVKKQLKELYKIFNVKSRAGLVRETLIMLHSDLLL